MANDVSYFKLGNDSTEYAFNDADAEVKITQETARATAAEQANAAAISAETSRATAAEEANATAISAETARAEGVEGTLADLTTTAKSNLVAAINELDSDLDTLNSKIAYSDGTITFSGTDLSFTPTTGRNKIRKFGRVCMLTLYFTINQTTTAGGGYILGTIPEAYRPDFDCVGSAPYLTNGNTGMMFVRSNGNLEFHAGPSTTSGAAVAVDMMWIRST